MKNKIFLDMDGTLSRFNVPNALKNFKNDQFFFEKLKAYKGIEVINELAKSKNIYIISASPHKKADISKLKWLDKYLPNIPKQNILLCRLGINKAIFIEQTLNIKINSKCYLLDDYTHNLIEWEQAGGTGIKRITHCADNSRKLWKGLELCKLEKIKAYVN